MMNNKKLKTWVIAIVLISITSLGLFVIITNRKANPDEYKNIEKETGLSNEELVANIFSGNMKDLNESYFEWAQDISECSKVIVYIPLTSSTKLRKLVEEGKLKGDIDRHSGKYFLHEKYLEETYGEGSLLNLSSPTLKYQFASMLEQGKIKVVKNSKTWDTVQEEIWSKSITDLEYSPVLFTYCAPRNSNLNTKKLHTTDGFIAILSIEE